METETSLDLAEKIVSDLTNVEVRGALMGLLAYYIQIGDTDMVLSVMAGTKSV